AGASGVLGNPPRKSRRAFFPRNGTAEQCTHDLLPQDLVGSPSFHPRSGAGDPPRVSSSALRSAGRRSSPRPSPSAPRSTAMEFVLVVPREDLFPKSPPHGLLAFAEESESDQRSADSSRAEMPESWTAPTAAAFEALVLQRG